MKIKTEGYYLSEPFHWVDWHASIKFEGDNFYILKFNLQRCFFDSVNDITKININGIEEKVNYGQYKIYENTVEIRYNPNTEFELKRIFTIVSPDVLLDENMKEYRYVEP